MAGKRRRSGARARTGNQSEHAEARQTEAMTTSWEHVASLYQGSRAVGGRIKVGDGRFEFAPHGFDRKTGGQGLLLELGSITSIEKTERSWKSPRKCLLIRTSSGVEAKFLVNKLDGLVDRLQDAVESELD